MHHKFFGFNLHPLILQTHTDYGFAQNEKIHDGISERTESYTYTETTRNTAGQILRTSYTDISGNTVKEVAGNNITYYTYDKSEYGYLTYDPKDLGTYNFGISTNAHIWKDLVPYLYWGNNRKDTTTRSQRILKASIGKFAGHMGEIKSALENMERTGL